MLKKPKRCWLDLVLCIDGSASMTPIMDRIRQIAMGFPDMVATEMARTCPVAACRAKVIVFRDYQRTDYPPMEESPFFNMNDPGERMQFNACIANIRPAGGGDDAENALEAIAQALKSQWTSEGDNRRHAVILFTDGPAHPLMHPDSTRHPQYPSDGMPADLDELFLWLREGIPSRYGSFAYDHRKGRLIVFAPVRDQNAWYTMYTWNNSTPGVFVVPTRPDGGCESYDIEDAVGILLGAL